MSEGLLDIASDREETQNQTPENESLEQEQTEGQAQDANESTQDESCQSEECQTALINFIKENFGEDLSHYKDDLEAIKGLINARKLLGKKQRDAELLATLRSKYGDEFIDALLSGQLPTGP
ncbi:MAG: hypothetical protein ACPL7K_01945, partial [Armatimonadota bacterium]